MSATTFDKLAYIDTLKASGIEEEQARALAGALDAALKDTVATKYDLVEMKTDMHADFVDVNAKMTVLEKRLDMLQWMVGGVGFGVLLLILRNFWS